MSRRFTIFSVCLLMALLLAACGSTATPASTASSSSSSGPAEATAAPTAAPINTPVPTSTPVPTNTPAPTDTPAPASGADCLVGVWSYADMSDYMASIFNQTGGEVTFGGTEGQITYTFGADGTAQLEADNYRMNMSVTAAGLNLPLAVQIDGSGSTHYQPEGADKIRFSEPDMNNLTFSATMNGQELFSATSDQLAAMFGASTDPQYNYFTYECSGDTLRYTPPVAGASPVTLTRVAP